MPFRAFPRLAIFGFLGVFSLLAQACASSATSETAVVEANVAAVEESSTTTATPSDEAISSEPAPIVVEDADTVSPTTSTSSDVDESSEESSAEESSGAASSGDVSADGGVEPSNAEPASTTTTTATTTTTQTPTTTAVPSASLGCAADIDLEQRVGQLMFPLVTQSELPVAAALAERGLIGGVVVLGNPTASIQSEIAAMQERSQFGPLIVAVDEEGGRVQRLASITSALPSARSVAQNQTLDQARELARDHAVAIGELGFTMNLAPVVDLDNGGFIQSRSFGSDNELVTDYGFATADGILDAGLTPVVKHFPGHGRGTDSHTGLPTLPGLDVLRADDLVPFVRAVERGDLPIMIGHLVVPGLTDGQPATLSSAAINGLLRNELGFDGLVMTDAFNMDAISDTTSDAEAARLSIGAGVDLVMLGGLGAVEGTVAAVVAAVEAGEITDDSITESFLRVLDTRGISSDCTG